MKIIAIIYLLFLTMFAFIVTACGGGNTCEQCASEQTKVNEPDCSYTGNSVTVNTPELEAL